MILKVFTFKTITILSLILITLFSPLPVQANGQTRLYLQNVPLQDDRLLAVNLSLADVVDLYGAEIQLRYDPTQLKVRDDNPRLKGVQIAPGPLLAFDNRFVATNNVDPETGLITFVFTLLKPAPPISGEGVLATIVFEIASDGPFSVEVVEARLVSSNLEAVSVTTEDLYLGGGPEPVTTPQLPVQVDAPAQRGWMTAVLLGLLAILAVLLLLRLRWAGATTTPGGAQSASRRIPGAQRSSTYSSALLTEQGNHALNQGNLQRAYELFSRAVELDPANAAAWLGKGLVAEQETEKRICLQRVLALDPDNTAARTELQRLETHTSDRKG